MLFIKTKKLLNLKINMIPLILTIMACVVLHVITLPNIIEFVKERGVIFLSGVIMGVTFWFFLINPFMYSLRSIDKKLEFAKSKEISDIQLITGSSYGYDRYSFKMKNGIFTIPKENTEIIVSDDKKSYINKYKYKVKGVGKLWALNTITSKVYEIVIPKGTNIKISKTTYGYRQE